MEATLTDISKDASGRTALDIVAWTGETPDKVLALGATEYSVSEARAIVTQFAEVTTSLNIHTFVRGFTEDCVVSFNERAGIEGRQGVLDLMGPRFEHFAAPGSDFVCRKALRSLTGNIFGVIWLNDWFDAKAKQRMRRTKRRHKRVIVDTTVQPKNVMFPTDARLLNRAREILVRLAKRQGLALRQSYARVGKFALIKHWRVRLMKPLLVEKV